MFGLLQRCYRVDGNFSLKEQPSRRACYLKIMPWTKDNAGSTDQSLLSRLPEHFLSQLFGRATTVRRKTGEALFLVGDIGDGCYRVDDGLLKVVMVSHTGKERILAFLGPGAIVGEMSIIDGLPRSADVVAVRPAVLSFVGRTGYILRSVKLCWRCLLPGSARPTWQSLQGPFCR
jgi:CRP-like cAMP-binding protein